MDAGQVRQCALLVKWQSLAIKFDGKAFPSLFASHQVSSQWWWDCRVSGLMLLDDGVVIRNQGMSCHCLFLQHLSKWLVKWAIDEQFLIWYVWTCKTNDTWSSFWDISSVCRSLAVKVLLADNDVGLVLAFRQGFRICLVFVEHTEPEDMLKWCAAGQVQWPKWFRVRCAC